LMVPTRFARRSTALAIVTGFDGADPLRPAFRRARDRHGV
jgi:hypothetical protein